MFDARSILEAMVRGAGGEGTRQQPAARTSGGDLGDIIGQLGRAFGQGGGHGAAGGAGGVGGLEDILRRLGAQDDARRPVAPGKEGDVDGEEEVARSSPPAGAGGLGDILGKLQEQLGAGGKGGGLMDVLGQVLGQAMQGTKEGMQRADEATGASGRARDVLSQTTGKTPEEIFAQIKDVLGQNQFGAGAAAGGLGAVLLGTKAGRGLAASALKIGGLALIGGLAYKALQNYQQGKPLIDGSQQLALAEAPRGSGYEAGAVTHESAMLLIRGMVAAAASDGRIDASEQKRILGNLQQAALGAAAEDFLANELNNPAKAEDLAAAVASEEQAVQLFTAARLAIDLDTDEEQEFLAGLAGALGLDEQLVAHIDAGVRAAA